MKSVIFLAVTWAITPVPVYAMDWCNLLEIIPRDQSDFEKISGSVETLTGCRSQPSDSAHRATWACPDDQATEEVYEGVHISLYREPGEGVYLVVAAAEIRSLDRLRGCMPGETRDGSRFVAGNVAYRDRLIYRGARLTLTSIVPGGPAAIISDRKSYGEDPVVTRFWRNLYGIAVEPHPSTEVRLSGLSPIENDAYAIVEAFKGRGAQVKHASDVNNISPKWSLSPPTGLAGVSEINIDGFVRHLHTARYVLNSTADYERYVGILDAEYGVSTRRPEGVCTYRIWESGRMLIRGEHCPSQTSSILFFNRTASTQLDQFLTNFEAGKKRSNDPKQPAIDMDNL